MEKNSIFQAKKNQFGSPLKKISSKCQAQCKIYKRKCNKIFWFNKKSRSRVGPTWPLSLYGSR